MTVSTTTPRAEVRQALLDMGAVPQGRRLTNCRLPVEGGHLTVEVHVLRVYGWVAVDRWHAGDLPHESTRAWAVEHLDPFVYRALNRRSPHTFGTLARGGDFAWMHPVLVSDLPELIRLWLPWEVEQQVTALPAMKAAWREGTLGA